MLSWVRRYIRVSREKLGKVRQKTYKQAHEIGKLKDQVKEYSKTQADRIITGRPLYEAIEKGYNDMEIARIMNVSNGSIRTMRYNIRKQDV